MALSKLNFNSLNLTPVAGKGIGFDSGADDLEASFSGGAMTFIKKLTASNSANLTFLNGSSSVVLDSTYKEYVFVVNNIHPITDNVNTYVNFTTDGTNYNATKTTTFFRAFHDEADNTAVVAYVDAQDLAQSTAGQNIGWAIGNGNDECSCVVLRLFNPASTTFVKHFTARVADYAASNGIGDRFVAGYCNTTSAVTGVQFQMSSGNINAGTITLYGIN